MQLLSSKYFSTSSDISKEVSDWVVYLVANLNGDASFLAPLSTSSDDDKSSQPFSQELETSYRQSPRSLVHISSFLHSGSSKSVTQAANLPPITSSSAPVSSAESSDAIAGPSVANSCPQPPVQVSDGIYSVNVFQGTLKDLPQNLEVVLLAEEEVGGAEVVAEQAGQEHMVIIRAFEFESKEEGFDMQLGFG